MPTQNSDTQNSDIFPILILEAIPKIRNPPLAKIVTIVKIVSFFKIMTPFSASQKCHYNEHSIRTFKIILFIIIIIDSVIPIFQTRKSLR